MTGEGLHLETTLDKSDDLIEILTSSAVRSFQASAEFEELRPGHGVAVTIKLHPALVFALAAIEESGESIVECEFAEVAVPKGAN